jgi:hypothetical protein
MAVRDSGRGRPGGRNARSGARRGPPFDLSQWPGGAGRSKLGSVMRRLHSIVLLSLLAWLPLQAVAVPLLAGCCPETAAAVADASPCHQHAADGDAAPADPAGAGDHDNPGHLCCPHFSAAPVHRLAFAAEPSRFDAPPVVPAARSHIPDQPQRPPRA